MLFYAVYSQYSGVLMVLSKLPWLPERSHEGVSDHIAYRRMLGHASLDSSRQHRVARCNVSLLMLSYVLLGAEIPYFLFQHHAIPVSHCDISIALPRAIDCYRPEIIVDCHALPNTVLVDCRLLGL